MFSKSILIAITLLSTSLVMTNYANAGTFYENRSGYAADGYDVVSYFSNQAVKGKDQFKTEHGGSQFRFSTAENLALFEASPEKYAPQFAGHCAYGVSKGSGGKYKVDGDAFAVIDGKLYMNYSTSAHSSWLKDTSGNIKKANKNWPNLEKK